MTEISLNYSKIEWTYDRASDQSNYDPFDFKGPTADDVEQELFDLAFSDEDFSDDSDIGMEELTIAHEYIERHDGSEVPMLDDYFA